MQLDKFIHQPTPFIAVLLGVVILLFGRRLFWLFVAAVGFAAGLQFTPYIVPHASPALALVVAIVLGILGAVLALILQKIAIGIAGFFFGGRFALALAGGMAFVHGNSYSIAFIIGGIIGAILLLCLFDWALILFSSIAGAELIVDNLHFSARLAPIIFICLTIVGILMQASIRPRRRVSP